MLRLSDKYLRALAHKRKAIVDDVRIGEIMPYLRSNKSFTEEDQEKVERGTDEKNRVSVLLDVLQSKHDSVFLSFLEVLSFTNDTLAEDILNVIENKGARKMSETEFGNILIQGGVPARFADYITRNKIEKQILTELKNDDIRPILIHGSAGCGKSSIVSNVLHAEGLFPQRYLGVCWMSIGHISEKDVLPKLITLCAKLDSDIPDTTYTIPDLYGELITKKLRSNNILLILDDVWEIGIMKYFKFPVRYIVTSRCNKLLPEAMMIEIPSKFSDNECQKYLGDINDVIDGDLIKMVIEVSHMNPLYLSMLKNLLKSKSDYVSRIRNKGVLDEVLRDIMKENLDILDNDKRRCYQMLAILDNDETVSLDLLTIYWDISDVVALGYLDFFFDNHLITKNWDEQTKCNMYGIHDIHCDYLKTTLKNDITKYQQTLIDRHSAKYVNWLNFDYSDPYFFIRCTGFIASYNVEKLKSFYTDFSFLASSIVIAGISDLLFTYETYRPSADFELWNEFHDFFMRHNHRFVNLPKTKLKIKIGKVFLTLIQLALFEDNSSNIFKKAKQDKDLSVRDDFWIWVNPKPSMKIWEANIIDDITMIDINHRGVLVATEFGRLGLYELKTGKCLFHYTMPNEKLVFCKFLKPTALEFVTMDNQGQIKFYDIYKLLSNDKKEEIDFDDIEFVDDKSVNNNAEVDFNSLRQKFQHLQISEFIEKCKCSTSKELKKSQIYVTAFLDTNRLTTVSYSRENVDIDEMIIESYQLDGLLLKDNFTVNYRIKKLIHMKPDGKYMQFYILREDGESVHLYDDLGSETTVISIGTKHIYDFIIVDRHIYFAADNEIHRMSICNSDEDPSFAINTNLNEKPLFSVINDNTIHRLSICHDKRLMALCLTNESVQIWKFAEAKVLYSIKGFNFMDAQFECCHHLVTIERNNVAKWSLNHLQHTQNIDIISKQSYRTIFHMHTRTASSVLWIIQKYNNELEFLSLENEQYSSNSVQMKSRATCFLVFGNYALVGFLDSNVQMFCLNNLSCMLFIGSVNNVNQMSTIFADDNHWSIAVNYNDNKLKIFRIVFANYSIVIESEEIEWMNFVKLKMFTTSDNKFIFGVYLKTELRLFNLKEDDKLIEFFTKPVDNNNHINDFDVNYSGEFICIATATGILKVWCINKNKWEASKESENATAVKRCSFRPKVQSVCNVIAAIYDDGTVMLYYIKNKELIVNKIIEDVPAKGLGIYAYMTWSNDGNYLILGDNDIKKWKLPLEPVNRDEVKHILTKLYTHRGGIRCVHSNNDFISTIDIGGYFYILRRSLRDVK